MKNAPHPRVIYLYIYRSIYLCIYISIYLPARRARTWERLQQRVEAVGVPVARAAEGAYGEGEVAPHRGATHHVGRQDLELAPRGEMDVSGPRRDLNRRRTPAPWRPRWRCFGHAP